MAREGADKRIERFDVVEINRSALKNAPYNPRTISDAARKKLKKGISKLGLLAPIVWNEKTGNIVSGHQRISILDSMRKSEGDYALKVSRVSLDVAEEKEANLLLNNAEAQGEWDVEKLSALVTDESLDLEATGFDANDVYRMFGTSPFENDNRSADLEKLAERFYDVQAGEDEHAETLRNAGSHKNSHHFYTVVVFKDFAARLEFTDALGLDDNRYQDGRILLRAARAWAKKQVGTKDESDD